MTNYKTKDFILYCIALIGLSTSAVLTKMAHADPSVLGFWRLGISTLILLPFYIGTSKSKIESKSSGVSDAIVSGVFFFVHLWTFFYSAQNTEISRCMILFSINPIFVSIFAKFLNQEPLNKKIAISFMLAFIGVYVLLNNDATLNHKFRLGDISALISATLYGLYFCFGKRARKKLSNIQYMTIVYGLSSVLFGITVYLMGLNFFTYPLEFWLIVAATILLPTFGGHALFSYLQHKMPLSSMSIGKLIEPALASLWASFIFSEMLGLKTIFSFFLTGSGIFILFYKSNKIPEPQKSHLL